MVMTRQARPRHRDHERAAERIAVRTIRRLVLVSCVGLAAGTVVIGHLTHPTGTDVTWQADSSEQWAARLVSQHDCWTGSPPVDMVGRLPGHVVARDQGAHRATYSTRLVSDALEHVARGSHPGMTVYGFCR